MEPEKAIQVFQELILLSLQRGLFSTPAEVALADQALNVLKEAIKKQD